MPERILRDLTDSDRYNAVSLPARDTFIRLINKADDFGLFYADARRLRPLLYPLLLETVREADLTRWIAECNDAGLVRLYKAGDGREYLQIRRWRQRLRNKKPKHPLPPWGCQADDGHLSDICQTDDGHPPSETETETETEFDLPAPAGTAWRPGVGWSGITPQLRGEWADAYPACDIDRQLAAMSAWLTANPRKAKKSNWLRFITNWLTRSQDRGGDPSKTESPFEDKKFSAADIDRMIGLE